MNRWHAKYKIPFDDPQVFFSDGVHPSELTYQLWAKNLVEFIQEHKILR
jgi:lysophospholipase L1-like esterase